MAFEPLQVAEIWVKATKSRGTGYLLCSGCLITACHVVKDCPATGVSFRLLGDFQQDPDRWLQSIQIWCDEEFDLALVFFDRKTPCYLDREVSLPPIARLAPNEPVSCQSRGFPAFAQSEGRYRDHPLKGTLQLPVSIKNPALANFQVEDPIPSTGMEAWKGYSGSPVFAQNGLLVGIVTQGFEEFRGEVIEVLSIGWILNHHAVGQSLIHEILTFSGVEMICRALTTADVSPIPLDQQLIPSEVLPPPDSRLGSIAFRDQVTRSIPPELTHLDGQEERGTAYLVLAVFWQQRTPSFFRVLPQLHYRDAEQDAVKTVPLTKDNCTVPQTDFPRFSAGLVDFATAKLGSLFPDPSVSWKLTIALFVPIDLLANPLSDWCGEQSSILQEEVLILGCSDRFNPDNPGPAARLHNALKRGWQKFQSCCPDSSATSLHCLDWLESRDPQAQSKTWENYAGVQCYGDWLRPGAEYLCHWQKLVKAGIPLALWMSDSQLDDSAIEACFSRLTQGNRFQFLEKIREIRQDQQAQQEAGTAAGVMGVLYEDPRYLPPIPQVEAEFFAWPGL